MGDLNTKHNRVCWCDIHVADLSRAVEFYQSVLNVSVTIESMEDVRFGVLEHDPGNGGCLVVAPDRIGREQGSLLYFNVDGRIRDAVRNVESQGGEILEPVHPIGPHGFSAIIRDSEGNRCALHSESDQ